jgi:hypothetical protein
VLVGKILTWSSDGIAGGTRGTPARARGRQSDATEPLTVALNPIYKGGKYRDISPSRGGGTKAGQSTGDVPPSVPPRRRLFFF